MRTRHFNFTLLLSILLSLTLALFLYNGWFGVSNGNGGSFCEAARDGIILQPVNSWSNIGFVVFGLLAAWQLDHTTKRHNNPFFTNTFYARAICSLMVLLGPCSMAMHATETDLGGLCDMNSMYLLASFMLAYACKRCFNLGELGFSILFLVGVIFGNISPLGHRFIAIDFFLGNLAFGFLCIVAILIETYNYYRHHPTINFNYAVACSIVFIIAFVIWNFGRDDSCICHPYSLLQLHGIWHILCATSVYLLFRFYISEEEHELK